MGDQLSTASCGGRGNKRREEGKKGCTWGERERNKGVCVVVGMDGFMPCLVFVCKEEEEEEEEEEANLNEQAGYVSSLPRPHMGQVFLGAAQLVFTQHSSAQILPTNTRKVARPYPFF